ncbi:MAG: hypothetical protein ACI8WI_001901, partial [Pseudoalteromonas distincta]
YHYSKSAAPLNLFVNNSPFKSFNCTMRNKRGVNEKSQNQYFYVLSIL